MPFEAVSVETQKDVSELKQRLPAFTSTRQNIKWHMAYPLSAYQRYVQKEK